MHFDETTLGSLIDFTGLCRLELKVLSPCTCAASRLFFLLRTGYGEDTEECTGLPVVTSTTPEEESFVSLSENQRARHQTSAGASSTIRSERVGQATG